MTIKNDNPDKSDQKLQDHNSENIIFHKSISIAVTAHSTLIYIESYKTQPDPFFNCALIIALCLRSN